MNKMPEHMPEEAVLGIDIGSVSVDIVLLNPEGEIIYGTYTRHHGQPDKVLSEQLHEVEKRHIIRMGAATGSGAKRLEKLTGIHAVNEVVAQVEAAKADRKSVG